MPNGRDGAEAAITRPELSALLFQPHLRIRPGPARPARSHAGARGWRTIECRKRKTMGIPINLRTGFALSVKIEKADD
jgi:hypothetical protein